MRNGNYVNVPLTVLSQGVKRVDVDALYDTDAYRPKIRHVDGKPMFLY
jgi:6-phosphofructokinase 1